MDKTLLLTFLGHPV